MYVARRMKSKFKTLTSKFLHYLFLPTCLISSPTTLHLLTVLLPQWPIMSLKQAKTIPTIPTLAIPSAWTVLPLHLHMADSSLLLAERYFTERSFFPWSWSPKHPQFTLSCFIFLLEWITSIFLIYIYCMCCGGMCSLPECKFHENEVLSHIALLVIYYCLTSYPQI